MKRKLPLTVVPLVVLTAVVLLSQSDSPARDATADLSSEKATAAAGMMLYVDPETGEFLETPAESFPVEMAEEGAYSTSGLGLIEIEAPVGGGKMMNLHGRFQQTYTAAVDGSGSLSATCRPHEETTPVGSRSEKEVEQP